MKVKYKSTCSRINLVEIRNFISAQVSMMPLSVREKHQVVLAIDEACSNAIIHGNNCDESKEILIELESNEKLLKVDISDIGTAQIPLAFYRRSDVAELIRKRRKGGLGLKLMNNIMDEVTFNERGGRYFCTLIKHFS